jgi:ABC-type glycerol-3-phosphate transport system substrate-binding protein
MHRRPWPLRVLPCIAVLLAASADAAAEAPHRPGGSEATQVRPGELVPPLVAPPCKPGACPFAGQHLRLLVTDSRPIGAPVLELKDEYEAATGATLEVVPMPREDLYANFAVDMIERTARYDAAVVSAAWLGDLVEGGRVAPCDRYYRDPRFPRWEMLARDLGKGWDHFLAGRAALALTWGDLGALAQQEGSALRGKVGTAPVPGTGGYYGVAQGRWIRSARPNRVGNTTGGSWAGMISRHARSPAAAYYVLALMATPPPRSGP